MYIIFQVPPSKREREIKKFDQEDIITRTIHDRDNFSTKLLSPRCVLFTETIIRLYTHFYLTPFALVTIGAFARKTANVISALSTIQAWIRFALIVLEVTPLTGETCK